MWRAGLLGNRTNLWDDPLEAIASGADPIGFREIGKAGGGAWCKVPRYEVMFTALEWQMAGRKFIMDDGAPDDCRVLQGELCRTYRGLEGYLDTVSLLPMRPAMAAGHMRHCSYATVRALLNRYVDPSSLDDIDDLFDLYPEATIEFSTFGKNVGLMPNRNTLIWEVRNYLWILFLASLLVC